MNPLSGITQGQGISTSAGLAGVVVLAVLLLFLFHFTGFRFVVAAGRAV